MMRKPRSKRKNRSLSAAAIAAIVVCCGGSAILAAAYFLLLADPGIADRFTNNAQPTTANLAAIIALTADTASTQTALANPPNAFSADLTTMTATADAAPSESLASTSTEVIVLPTNTLPLVIAVACSCSGDSLNCSDFPNRSDAQACFNYCVQQGFGDVYLLDRDDNGVACESS